MYLIHEDLARVHIRERQQEAEEARVAYGLLDARKAERKAEHAQRRAERARRKADQAQLAAKRLLASMAVD